MINTKHTHHSLIIHSDDDTKGSLYLGNITSAYENNLKEYKIGAVISAASDTRLKYNGNIKHLELNLEDISEQDIFQYFEQSIEFIITNLKCTNVLVHCFAGVSRSTTIIIAYLMKIEQMNYKQALEYVKKRRHYAWPNPGFRAQLEQYEKHIEQQQNI